MLIRIVRMEFKPEKVADFLALFETVEEKISSFPGCLHLQLCKDAGARNVYYTFSKWEQESDLEKYRHSPLFEDTWAKTKVLFGGKPMAYSMLPEGKA